MPPAGQRQRAVRKNKSGAACCAAKQKQSAGSEGSPTRQPAAHRGDASDDQEALQEAYGYDQDASVGEDDDNDDDHVLIVVPDGHGAGDSIVVELADGHEIEVEIPEGCVAGDEFEVDVAAVEEGDGADHDAELHVEAAAEADADIEAGTERTEGGDADSDAAESFTGAGPGATPNERGDGTFELTFPHEGTLGFTMRAERGRHVVEPTLHDSANPEATAHLTAGDTLVEVAGRNVEGQDLEAAVIPAIKAKGRPLTLGFRHAAQDGELYPGLRAGEAARATLQFRALDSDGSGTYSASY